MNPIYWEYLLFYLGCVAALFATSILMTFIRLFYSKDTCQKK